MKIFGFLFLAVVLLFSTGAAFASVQGDVNGDEMVDINDLKHVRSDHLISRLGDARFDPLSDMNGDGRINILDLIRIRNIMATPSNLLRNRTILATGAKPDNKVEPILFQQHNLPAPGATLTAASTLTTTTTLITNVDGDNDVDVDDLKYVRDNGYLNAKVGSDNYDERVDVNHDGRINILDLIFIRNDMGRTENVSQLNTPLQAPKAPGAVIDKDSTFTITLKGDINSDNEVNYQDLLAVRDGNMLGPVTTEKSNGKADYNQDGKVNVLDLILIRNDIGLKIVNGEIVNTRAPKMANAAESQELAQKLDVKGQKIGQQSGPVVVGQLAEKPQALEAPKSK